MQARLTILHGQAATTMERLACDDLKKDIEQVGDVLVDVKEESSNSEESSNLIILVGSPATSTAIATLSSSRKIPVTASFPGSRGGCIHVVQRAGSPPIIALAGSDAKGAQHVVYDFSREVLGIDPFQWWTGYEPARIADLQDILPAITSQVIQPPRVPILGYFDNDNDELANMTKPYLEFNLETWKALIDAIVRLKYNAIDMHDHLGRSEFYRWPFYKQLRPDYEPNVKLLDAVIDYAHQKGVKIQVSFFLGWKFKSISDPAASDYWRHKQEWLDTWRYYLKHTPIGKCDIFLNRPRDQRWDRRYKGANTAETARIFNDAFHEMHDIIKKHNPDAIIICDLYSEGMGVFDAGFAPEPAADYVMAWPDDGFGAFKRLPASFRGYKFGTYVHAGFFLNHVVQDPYPELLETQLKDAIIRHGMDAYCLVNGQTFRHYMLNLEACSALCIDPASFDAVKFYKTWTTRYFGAAASEPITRAMQLLHEAQANRSGYISLMQHVTSIAMLRLKLIKALRFLPRSWVNGVVNKIAKQFQVNKTVAQLERNVVLLKEATELAQSTAAIVSDQANFFHDQVLLPITLLLQINQIALELDQAAIDGKRKMHVQNAIELFKQHHATRMSGDKHPRWATWYDPDKRRPNGGYPTLARLEKLL